MHHKQRLSFWINVYNTLMLHVSSHLLALNQVMSSVVVVQHSSSFLYHISDPEDDVAYRGRVLRITLMCINHAGVQILLTGVNRQYYPCFSRCGARTPLLCGPLSFCLGRLFL